MWSTRRPMTSSSWMFAALLDFCARKPHYVWQFNLAALPHVVQCRGSLVQCHINAQQPIHNLHNGFGILRQLLVRRSALRHTRLGLPHDGCHQGLCCAVHDCTHQPPTEDRAIRSRDGRGQVGVCVAFAKLSGGEGGAPGA
jgi:hypothetical protein